MNLLPVFWTLIVYTALISFIIMSGLIIYRAYFELKNMLRGMDNSKTEKDKSREA